MAEQRPAPRDGHDGDAVGRHDGSHEPDAGLRPGVEPAEAEEHVPRPTYWPAVLAFGLTFAFWGLITTPIITVVGLVVFAIGLAGWIGELRHGA